MSGSDGETLSVVIEREMPFPPELIWRALTQPHLVGEWLMAADIRPEAGHGFRFTADWGVIDCEVLVVETGARLAYSWVSQGLDSVVTWTLEPTEGGTRLRMEQVGFRPDQPQAYQGARFGWPRFLARLDALLTTLD